MSYHPERRALVASIAMATCFTAFSFRLVQLQVTKHDYYSAKAAGQNVHKEPILARRGAIMDVHGEPLAQNEPVKTVIADGSLINDPEQLGKLLTGPLQMPVGQIVEKLQRTTFSKSENKEVPLRYIVLKKQVPEAEAASIAALLPGARKSKIIEATPAIRFDQDSVRTYPNGSMLSHVIGYINSQSLGMDGVERSMNQYLTGQNGYRYIERDRSGQELVPYRGQELAPGDGANVRLTVDMGLQQIVENEIDNAMRQFRPKKATIILLNPKTGEILALANRPTYDLNDKRDVPDLARKNIAIMDQFEPGSTFKIVAAATALSLGIVSPDTEIFCENGYWQWCRLNDHHPYAGLTVENILVKSSNIGVAKLGIQLGEAKFFEYVRKFGFGEKTSVNLPGEIRGSFAPPYEWSKISITRIPMGHEVAATPLQIASAMGVIANGGKLMMPQIIRDVVNSEGRVVAQYPPREVRRVVSEKAAGDVRDALVKVVGPKGTAALAKVAGFKVAGKTGTAQKSDEHGRMTHEKYVVSFAGFMPADDPAFVGLVLLDEAHAKPGENYGGLVAAPIFARVAEKAARYLNLQPTEIDLQEGIVATDNRSSRTKRKP